MQDDDLTCDACRKAQKKEERLQIIITARELGEGKVLPGEHLHHRASKVVGNVVTQLCVAESAGEDLFLEAA